MKNICQSKTGGLIVGLPTEGMPLAIRFALGETPAGTPLDRPSSVPGQRIPSPLPYPPSSRHPSLRSAPAIPYPPTQNRGTQNYRGGPLGCKNDRRVLGQQGTEERERVC